MQRPTRQLLLFAAAAALAARVADAGLFSGVFSDGAVLQRAPARAALFGALAAPPAAAAHVTVNVSDAASGWFASFGADVALDGTWKVLLDARPAFGNISVAAACDAGCTSPADTAVSTLADLTFGDVWYNTGQSNMWLPLKNTFDRNASLAALLAGKYSNLRFFNLPSASSTTPRFVVNASRGPGPNDGFWRRASSAAADIVDPATGESAFVSFSATAWYFAQALTDLMQGNGSVVPVGLVHTAVGGTMIEQWSPFDAQAACVNATCLCTAPGCDQLQPINAANCTGNGQLFNALVAPFVNMSVFGWLWYQGENNMGRQSGNAMLGTGYACSQSRMISAWRALWAAAGEGATSPTAPFGLTVIADDTDEGAGSSCSKFRWAQTANVGTVPNEYLPHTFAATAHDISEPWGANCISAGCCLTTPPAPGCSGDRRWPWETTVGVYGPGLHPRDKLPLGERLALAAWRSEAAYGAGGGPAIGPVISGCTVAPDGRSLTLRFNATLLAGASVAVSDYNKSEAVEASAVFVLVNATLPADEGQNFPMPSRPYSPFGPGPEWGVFGWVNVGVAALSSTAVTVDLSRLNGATPTAIRYAAGSGGILHDARICCGAIVLTTEPCPPGSCPITAGAPVGSGSGGALPAMPFLAAIEGGVCKCLPPQVCDEQ